LKRAEKAWLFEGRFEIEDDLEIRLAAKGKVSMAPFANKVDAWISSGAQVVMTCSTLQQANRLKEILGNYGVPCEPGGAGLA
jgi:hypothetical protein